MVLRYNETPRGCRIQREEDRSELSVEIWILLFTVSLIIVVVGLSGFFFASELSRSLCSRRSWQLKLPQESRARLGDCGRGRWFQRTRKKRSQRVCCLSIVLSCTRSNVSTARTLVSQPRSEMLRLVYAGCPGGDKRRKGERLSGRVRIGDKARASFIRLHRAEKQFDGVSLARWVSA